MTGIDRATEGPQCPHEVVRATCPGCNCPCDGCARHNAEWAALDATRATEGLSESEREILARRLMADHGCIHHQGPNPLLNPCRACMRRVGIVDDFLAARAAQPDPLREALTALADEWADRSCYFACWSNASRSLRALLARDGDQ